MENRKGSSQWLDAGETARLLGVSLSTLANWRNGYQRRGVRCEAKLKEGVHWVRHKKVLYNRQWIEQHKRGREQLFK